MVLSNEASLGRSIPENTDKINHNMSSDHTKFVEGYCALYREFFKEPYVFHGAKDGAAIKRLLGAGVAVEKALSVAGESFRRSGYPWDMASSISSFVSAWSIIVAALAKNPNNEPFKTKPLSRYEIRQQMDIVKIMIAKHPHNEESIYHSPQEACDTPLPELRRKLAGLEKQLVGV